MTESVDRAAELNPTEVDLPYQPSQPALPTTHEGFSIGLLAGLTPRQQTVATKLLEGHSRKTIAKQLNITLDTVGDHVKSIYAHFGVGSIGELAALFLRSR